MSEIGEEAPINPIVPPDSDKIGSIAWSQFPREIFPIATTLAAQILADPQHAEAYDLYKRITKADDLLKMTRRRVIKFQNIPSKEDDPDIEDRWSDESIERTKSQLDVDRVKREADVTALHEELRTKSLSPEFEQTYRGLSSKAQEIVDISLKGFNAKAEEANELMTRTTFNNYAEELIDYNLDSLGNQK